MDVECRLVVSGVDRLDWSPAAGIRVAGGQRENSLVELLVGEQGVTIQIWKKSKQVILVNFCTELCPLNAL